MTGRRLLCVTFLFFLLSFLLYSGSILDSSVLFLPFYSSSSFHFFPPGNGEKWRKEEESSSLPPLSLLPFIKLQRRRGLAGGSKGGRRKSKRSILTKLLPPISLSLSLQLKMVSAAVSDLEGGGHFHSGNRSVTRFQVHFYSSFSLFPPSQSTTSPFSADEENASEGNFDPATPSPTPF